jgi:hypothetical protein
MAEGEFALVRQSLDVALTLAASTWVGEHDLYAQLADAAVLDRQVDALRQYAPLAEAAANRVGHPLYQGVAQRAWGVLHRLTGDYAASDTRLHLALDVFGPLGTQWQLGRTHFELGELFLVQGDNPAARDALACALKAFETMGAMPDVERTRSLLARLL